jgi:hypothetical protein
MTNECILPPPAISISTTAVAFIHYLTGNPRIRLTSQLLFAAVA